MNNSLSRLYCPIALWWKSFVSKLRFIGGIILDLENKKYIIRYVAIYIRKSRAESMKDLEKHRMVLIELCKKHNFKYVEYIEVGTSDSIDLRPKISKLLEEVSEGVYDAVCVVEYDRLGRGDLGEQDRIKKAFQKSNTLIISPDKIFDLNDDIDDTYADFKGFFARQEYKMITKRLRQGKQIGARRGQWTNGVPPFPYVYQRYKEKENLKGLVVHDERYETYRYIVSEALKGIPPQKISEDLNRKGILTLKSKFWSGMAIQRLLVDETHLGKIISNKTKGDGHKRKRPNAKTHQVLPKSEWVVVENCHQAVKTQEEHDIILFMIANRKMIGTKARHQTYAFSGLIRCENCGHSHTFYTKRDDLYMKPCWYISPTGKKCRNEGIKVSAIENLVLAEIDKYKESFLLGMPEIEEEEILNDTGALIAEHETKLQRQLRSLEIVNDAYEYGDYSREEWLRRKKKWEDEIYNTKNQIYELHKRAKSTIRLTPAERSSKMLYFLDNITSTMGHATRNELYRTIVESIIWRKAGDDIKVSINFK
jgi:site-specific DNA recombinase